LIDAQPLPRGGDTGINVLIDHAHQFLFFCAWDIPPLLREGGFRVVTSQASLDTVLDAGKTSLVRVGRGNHRPFAQWPNPRFNVVITYQVDPEAQQYLPEEVAAVRQFVQDGGGLVINRRCLYGADQVAQWPLNVLAAEFGAEFAGNISAGPFSRSDDTMVASLELPSATPVNAASLDSSWQPLVEGSDGGALVATRRYGKGRVVIVSDLEITKWGKDGPGNGAQSKAANGTFLHRMVAWAAGGSNPVGGSPVLPCEAWGGGAIYPELRKTIGGMTVLYAKNQKDSILRVVTDDMPAVKAQLQIWLPSAPPDGEMYFDLASGAGGGWAVNVYEPKEVGIIALDREGILSIFAHELAHTMGGPPNEKGHVAGVLPWQFSEAHAGWFQGKIEALRTGSRGWHEPNLIWNIDPDGRTLDLTRIQDTGGENEKAWRKLWWVFQRLDDAYGPTWYPRWLWVKNVRWQSQPRRQLSWDEVVEDMSIAVCQDLFPFFRSIGTTLNKEHYPVAEFMGRSFELCQADISATEAGPVRLDAPGDYRQSLCGLGR